MDPVSIALGLAQVVPTIAGWLGGDDAEEKAKKFVNAAEVATGKSGQAAVEQLKNDPDALYKFKAEVEKLETQLAIAEIRDRQHKRETELQNLQSARQRDVELNKTRGNNWRADVLAISAIAGLIALIYTLLFVDIEAGPARDTLIMLSGALVVITKEVYGFEFGSSRGSKDKDRKLENIAR